MSAKSHEDLLVETLEQAGVLRSDARRAEIISWAGEDPEANDRVHTKTNATIFELLHKNELGKCVHVTGGARALTDPYHRQMCEAIRGEHKEPFRVLYHVPKDLGGGPWDLVQWNLSRWGAKGFSDWRQKLLTLNMIGSRAVDLKAYDERGRIQYSVFGNRYVQVQGRHEDTALAKYVWLIRSENVNGRLAETAEGDLRKASEVDERCFKNFVSALFTNTARKMLWKIMEGKTLTREQLLEDKNISLVDSRASEKLDALRVMGFVVRNPTGALTITEDGQSFVQSV
jgi:hypothetical protein